MTGEDKQQKALDVLKSLNAAVTTTKLYPPSFPQVAEAVETAFSQARSFLRNYGECSFSITDDTPTLCGQNVREKTLGRIHGEEIYQQLRLLRIEHVVLQRGLTRKTFQQILVFFTTSPQLINREGGGRVFVASLGLQHIFPQHHTVDQQPLRQDFFSIKFQHYNAEEAVTDELIAALSSEIDGETAAGQKKLSLLTGVMQHPDDGLALILASIAAALKGVCRRGSIFFPLQFGQIVSNINRITDSGMQKNMAAATAKVLLNDLDAFALHVLLLQEFSRGFGGELYLRLLIGIGTEFEEIVKLMREEDEIAASTAGRDSAQYIQIEKGIRRLLATDKGKQFLAREKARGLIEAGERQRQAQRVQKGITAILQGDVNSLKNREVIGHLPATIASLLSNKKDGAAAKIIENITTELLKEDNASHEPLSESLSVIGDSLIDTGKWDWLEKLTIPLMAWVKSTDRADATFENIISILQKLLDHFWKAGKNEEADRLLMLFFAIRIGKLRKSDAIKKVVGRIQDLSVDMASLPHLLSKSMDGKNTLADRRLIMQGPVSARFLLNALFASSVTEERMKIMDLLSRVGPLLPPLALEKLKEPMPWYDKRNLIHLLYETGGRRHVKEIFEYLNHDDTRVQKETFNCIYKISGKDRKKNLLKALSFSSGRMREQAVKALTPMADDEVVEEVIKLLGDWRHLSENVRDSLIIQICTLLAKCKSVRGEEALENFLENEGKVRAKQLHPSVWKAASSALRQIKQYNREREKKQVREAADHVSSANNTALPKKKRSSFDEEAHIEKLLADGDKDKAKKILVELIYKAAELNTFNEAEALRNWLIEIDPMALTEIIRTAEAIEEQKSVSINTDYLQIWSKLYDNLTTEEFNALYYSMEHISFAEETVLVKQGMSQPVLFFINHGQVKLYYNEKNNEVLVKVARQGDVLGIDTFFDASIWTINAAALTKVEISSLSLKNTGRWKDEFPALESKLQDFCREFENLNEYLNSSKKNRRAHDRHAVTGRVSATIMESNGNGVQMTGELADISRGGTSFVLRISHKKNARVLLGRNIRLQLSCATAQGKILSTTGVLLTVKSLYSMNNEYSAHVKFDNLITRQELHGILEAGEVFTK